MTLASQLQPFFSPEQLKQNEPMSRHTTMRVGGPAEMMVCPTTVDQVMRALDVARELEVPVLILGNGSNLLIRDGGIDGLVIDMCGLNHISVEGDVLTAQAGAMMSTASAEALKHGLCGLEFISGIPGTIGGGSAMNAGAYNEELSDVLIRVYALVGKEARWYEKAELQMGYRTTRILKEKGVVLSAQFGLKPNDPAEIKAKMDDLNARRREKQPLNLPSSGSTFKRPAGHFAGALIEGAGLKGKQIGQAQVSEKHAGFVVNLGGATSWEVLSLISYVQSRVYSKYGVALEPEVRIMGKDLPEQLALAYDDSAE